MNLEAIEVDAADVAKGVMMTVEIKVKNMRLMRARIWVGSRIMIFGAWVIGVGRCKIIESPTLEHEAE